MAFCRLVIRVIKRLIIGMFFQFLSDILQANVWRVSSLVKDPSLEKFLPNLVGLQMKAKAPSTVRKYQSTWLKWRCGAPSKSGVGVIPAEPLHVALFLIELAYSTME